MKRYISSNQFFSSPLKFPLYLTRSWAIGVLLKICFVYFPYQYTYYKLCTKFWPDWIHHVCLAGHNFINIVKWHWKRTVLISIINGATLSSLNLNSVYFSPHSHDLPDSPESPHSPESPDSLESHDSLIFFSSSHYVVINRHGVPRAFLETALWLIKVSDWWFVKISLRRRHPTMV